MIFARLIDRPHAVLAAGNLTSTCAAGVGSVRAKGKLAVCD